MQFSRQGPHVLVACALFGVVSCSSSSKTDDGTFPAAPAATGGDDAGAGSPGTFSDPIDAAAPDAEAPKIVFYANTDTTLYKLDPDNVAAPMVEIGDFDCVGAGTSVMTDIAVDKTGKLYGVSASAAWPLTIQGNVVHCDAKWPLAYGTHFNGLTVAPENTVDADEVLIGGNGLGELYRIDSGTGKATQIGTLGNDPTTGRAWTISGDMVFLANGGSPVGFATVRTCETPPATGCDRTDTLLEIDVKALKPGAQSVAKSVRGVVNKGSWCTNPSSPTSFGSMFGIVAFKDKAYGFSRGGALVEMLNDTGAGCLVWSNTTLKFAGAGVTTIAPITAPGPR